MSIEVDWDRLTQGPDGEALAESIRSFIHERFQQVQLPRFIRSVKALGFEFGTVAPQLDIKDVCDPLPDFYDSDEDEGDLADEEGKPDEEPNDSSNVNATQTPVASPDPPADQNLGQDEQKAKPRRPPLKTALPAQYQHSQTADLPISLPGSARPGIPGGTSNLSYFHLPLSAGLSGVSTPVGTAGPRFGGSLLGHLQHNNSTLTGTNNAETTPVPEPDSGPPLTDSPSPEQSANDLQIVTHLRYDGDVRLSLTAEVTLDYPMNSFVGIPLQLNVTGLTFDGVAILAYIKHKMHFCFLAPEDADALVGGEDANELSNDPPESHRIDDSQGRKPIGGLFEEIRVESEIGEREKGKQVLKNIGKVEKFVLDQVRRIFEDELVYPSFWTFLV